MRSCHSQSCLIVPVGIVGAEEQMPALFSSKHLGAPFGLGIFAYSSDAVAAAGSVTAFYGEPIDVATRFTPEDADDPVILEGVAAEVQAAVQSLLERGLSERKGIFR